MLNSIIDSHEKIHDLIKKKYPLIKEKCQNQVKADVSIKNGYYRNEDELIKVPISAEKVKTIDTPDSLAEIHPYRGILSERVAFQDRRKSYIAKLSFETSIKELHVWAERHLGFNQEDLVSYCKNFTYNDKSKKFTTIQDIFDDVMKELTVVKM